jgi:hypothetical protein
MAHKLRRFGKAALVLAACAALMTTTAATGTAGAASRTGSPSRILVDGQVTDRRTFTFDQLRALPQY